MTRSRANQYPQGSFANNGAHIHGFKCPWKCVTTTSCPTIDQHCFWSIITLAGYAADACISPCDIVKVWPVKHFNKTITKLPACIKTFIDDKPFLIYLSIKLTKELGLAICTCIRHVHIGKFSSTQL